MTFGVILTYKGRQEMRRRSNFWTQIIGYDFGLRAILGGLRGQKGWTHTSRDMVLLIHNKINKIIIMIIIIM